MNITELALHKKLFGGGGGKREGTAIKAGEVYEKIYFNSNNSMEETRAILSQLTYVDIGIGDPVYFVYGNTADGVNGTFLYIEDLEDGVYQIMEMKNISTRECVCYFSVGECRESNSWCYWAGSQDAEIQIPMLIAGVPVYAEGQSLTDFMGLPIGTDNEKLKNVISATPF